MSFEPFKVVDKPWGYEVWLALNEKYCFKKLVINAGEQFSLQYHRKKKETIVVHSGQAKIVLDGEDYITQEGDVLDIPPGTIHRIQAVSKLVLYEASTPEVDDVVRLTDDYGRTKDE